MISEHSDFYLPNLATFQNDNGYLGSFHGLRFQVKPNISKDDTPSTLEALVWYGVFCLELSQVEDTASFPLDDRGYADLLVWLDEQFQIMKEKECAAQEE